MTDHTFPVISGLDFLAPRNLVSNPYARFYAAEDNSLHFGLNGTYDKLFPLYALTNIKGENEDTYRPKFKLVNELNAEKELRGRITPTIFKEKQNRREIGAKDNPNQLFANPNLVKNVIYSREFYMQKFTPGWTTIQTFGTIPSYVVTCPGDLPTAKANIAFPLGNSQLSTSAEAFNIGSIVEFKGNVWRCVEKTNAFPPEKIDELSLNWTNMPERQTIFSAYIYAFVGDDLAFQDIYEENRDFVPSLQENLVSWNVSCYYI